MLVPSARFTGGDSLSVLKKGHVHMPFLNGPAPARSHMGCEGPDHDLPGRSCHSALKRCTSCSTHVWQQFTRRLSQAAKDVTVSRLWKGPDLEFVSKLLDKYIYCISQHEVSQGESKQLHPVIRSWLLRHPSTASQLTKPTLWMKPEWIN